MCTNFQRNVKKSNQRGLVTNKKHNQNNCYHEVLGVLSSNTNSKSKSRKVNEWILRKRPYIRFQRVTNYKSLKMEDCDPI